jgi:hypothetical protein
MLIYKYDCDQTQLHPMQGYIQHRSGQFLFYQSSQSKVSFSLRYAPFESRHCGSKLYLQINRSLNYDCP